jgi:hypothetical protein
VSRYDVPVQKASAAVPFSFWAITYTLLAHLEKGEG